ncbi:MAG: tripartite tricarboxylate transporter substrate binding protein, partial [Hyphomicrobiales bacterium]|nr:tripartite tricarboxylate transporter substrate binding protein [Hyphomicrobiales bacterium]
MLPARHDASSTMRRSLLAAACALTMLDVTTLGLVPASAQDYPARNIRMVVPFPAGGGTDTMARVLSQKLSDAFKHTVVIDNIGGASGALGHEAVARAAPDGYTLLVATGSTIATNPLVSKVSWDPVKDFTPVAMLVIDPMPLVLHPGLPARNVRELIAL